MKKFALISLSLFGMLFLSNNLFAENGSNVQQLTEKSFTEFVNQNISIVDFYADWCGPCKRFAPIFMEASNELEGVISFGKINVDQQGAVCNKYNIMYIPTIIIFKNGVEVQRKVGGMEMQELVEFIESAIE